MRWKKIAIVAALFIVVLVAALYAFVEFFDFNKFKPWIAKAVKDATGRELNIKGEIEIDFGFKMAAKSKITRHLPFGPINVQSTH